MKKLNDIGYIKPGMVLVDKDGKEGKVTGVMVGSGFRWVEMDGNKNEVLMWDWERVRNDVCVKDGTY